MKGHSHKESEAVTPTRWLVAQGWTGVSRLAESVLPMGLVLMESHSCLADTHVGELRIAFGPGLSLENVQNQRATRLEMQTISWDF